MQVVKTILADDHRIFLEGLKTVLRRSVKKQFEIAGVAYNGQDLMELIKQRSADLLILDLSLPQKDGIEIIKAIRSGKMPIKILVLTGYDTPRIVKRAIKAGANGYILKTQKVQELFDAMQALLAGEEFFGEGIRNIVSGKQRKELKVKQYKLGQPYEDAYVKKHSLTKRELEILHLIAQALSNKEIARELFISDQTVSVHRKNIMRKLGVSNTAGLIRVAYDFSLV